MNGRLRLLHLEDDPDYCDLAEKLWAERPSLKVIFTSGYSSDVVGKDFVLRPGINYIQKPYHPHKVVQAVREYLDAAN